MNQQFFTTQVQDITLTENEIMKILLENIQVRAKISNYDFDHSKPVIIKKADGGLTFRFLQGFVLKDSSPDKVYMTPLEKYKVKDDL